MSSADIPPVHTAVCAIRGVRVPVLHQRTLSFFSYVHRCDELFPVRREDPVVLRFHSLERRNVHVLVGHIVAGRRKPAMAPFAEAVIHFGHHLPSISASIVEIKKRKIGLKTYPRDRERPIGRPARDLQLGQQPDQVRNLGSFLNDETGVDRQRALTGFDTDSVGCGRPAGSPDQIETPDACGSASRPRPIRICLNR